MSALSRGSVVIRLFRTPGKSAFSKVKRTHERTQFVTLAPPMGVPMNLRDELLAGLRFRLRPTEAPLQSGTPTPTQIEMRTPDQNDTPESEDGARSAPGRDVRQRYIPRTHEVRATYYRDGGEVGGLTVPADAYFVEGWNAVIHEPHAWVMHRREFERAFTPLLGCGDTAPPRETNGSAANPRW
jgi:hypothetical protein